MPQPLPPKHSGATYEPNPIKARPEAAAAMANALAAWNLFEWELGIAYSVAMGFYLPGIKGWSPPNHPLAFQIFDTLSGLGARLDLLEKCVELVAPSVAPDLAALRDRIRKLAGKRADIAHGRWGVNDKYPNDIILSQHAKRMTRWNTKDFDQCAEQFAALRFDFGKVLAKLSDVASQRQGLTPPPEFFGQGGEPQPQK